MYKHRKKSIFKNKYDVASFVFFTFIIILISYYFITINKDNNKIPITNNINTVLENKLIINNSTTSTTTEKLINKIIKQDKKYVKVIDSCGVHFDKYPCVKARSCPSLSCPVIENLRNNIVLETDGEITESEGISWYHIIFSEWVRYPERTAKDWYISSDYLEQFDSYTEKISGENKVIIQNNKKIIVKLSEQKLYAYEGDNLFMETSISSGLKDLPTPRGNFKIFEKTPSRYMQGPLPGISDQYYDLPGVPWTMYFTEQGAAIHGAYWHDNFGREWSHGCVNVRPDEAEKLYKWAELGTQVIVQN